MSASREAPARIDRHPDPEPASAGLRYRYFPLAPPWIAAGTVPGLGVCPFGDLFRGCFGFLASRPRLFLPAIARLRSFLSPIAAAGAVSPQPGGVFRPRRPEPFIMLPLRPIGDYSTQAGRWQRPIPVMPISSVLTTAPPPHTGCGPLPQVLSGAGQLLRCLGA
jgi:hypothetical protein